MELKDLISGESKFRQFSSSKFVIDSVANVIEDIWRASCSCSGERLLQ